jgi:hypothetical protein
MQHHLLPTAPPHAACMVHHLVLDHVCRRLLEPKAIAASKQRLETLIAETNVRIDAAKAEGEADIADALRASLELEITFAREQEVVWQQWREQQEKEKAGAEAKFKGGGDGARSGGGAALAPTVTKPQRKTSVIDEECPCCLDVFEDPFKTVCGHTFCRECIEDWLGHTPNCPMCRADISLTSVK